MNPLNDETLMAYADRALPAEDCLAVERVLVADRGARRLVLMFRLSEMCVKEAFSLCGFKPVPKRLQSMFSRPVSKPARRMNVWLLPIAASVVVAVGAAVVAHQILEGRHADRVVTGLGEIPAGNDLAGVLNRHENTTFTPASGAADRYVVVGTMRDRFDSTCHEVNAYSSARSDVPDEVIIACKSDRGTWSVVGAAQTKANASTAYVPNEQEVHGALKGVLAMIGAKSSTSSDGKESKTP
ncbi:MAG: hypothetical protein ACT4N2_05805 [Hyphomicrobium sp.]